MPDTDVTLRNAYRDIRVYYEGPESETLWKDIRPSVSYDTVPKYIGYAATEDMEGGFPGVEIQKHTYPIKTDLSRQGSNRGNLVFINPKFLLHNHVSSDDNYEVEKIKKRIFDSGSSTASDNPLSLTRSKKSEFNYTVDGKIIRSDYPTKPVFVNKVIIRSRTNVNFDKRWEERKNTIYRNMENKDKVFIYPDILFPQQREKPLIMGDDYVPITREQRRKNKILTIKMPNPTLPRTIVCYISGRRHSWVALDWVVRRLVENDHLVIIANIPRMTGRKETTKDSDRDTEWVSGYSFKEIDDIILNLFDYVKVIKEDSKTLKVTIEISIEKTKGAIIDAINVYNPDYIVLGTLRWQRYENLVCYRGRTLVDLICTTFSIPVFVVPARRLFAMEREIEGATLEKVIEIQKSKQGNLNGLMEEAQSLKMVSSDSFTFWSKNEQKILDESYSRSPIPEEDDRRNSADIISNASSSTDRSSYAADPEDFGTHSITKQGSQARHSITESNGSVVSQLKSIVTNNRKNMMSELFEIANNPVADPEAKETKLSKLDVIIKYSLESSTTIKVITENLDEDHSGYGVLKRVITGDSANDSGKPMLSMVDTVRRYSANDSDKVEKTRKRLSQIKFASDVKNLDGNAALGTPKNYKYSASHSSSGHSLKHVDSSESVLSFTSNNSKNSKKSSEKNSGSSSSNKFFMKVRRSSNSDQVSTNSSMSTSRLKSPKPRRSSTGTTERRSSTKSSAKKKIGKIFSFGNF
ncbi:Uncharacterized protein RNJ44_01394 [Nakaseomyces bracarensis]|uniref:UspA domain-containing protein n=1 Tax=Nakaseomyces bracarensis TaxID=273131 RepID=A0ABR4NPK3_9SACH